jgi:hypothetical protein
VIYFVIYLGIAVVVFAVAAVITVRELYQKKFEHFDDMVQKLKGAGKDLVAALCISIVWPLLFGILFYEEIWLPRAKPWVNRKFFGYAPAKPPEPEPEEVEIEIDEPDKSEVEEIWNQRNLN